MKDTKKTKASTTKHSPETPQRAELHQTAGKEVPIPGVVGAHGKVGPSLEGIAGHSYIGQLPNQLSNLERWIQHPHSVHPDRLMPELGVTDAESRDIAAYLYSLN